MSVIVDNQENKVILIESEPNTIIIQAVGTAGPSGVGVPSGGKTGEVLSKKTNTDFDTEWVDLNSKMIVTSIIFG